MRGPSAEKGRITSFLFREAKANCFPKELSRFDVLLEEVRDVTESLTRLANDGIADLVATKIPQAATYEMQKPLRSRGRLCGDGDAPTRGNLFERFVHEFDPVALDPNLQWGNAGIEGTVKNFQFQGPTGVQNSGSLSGFRGSHCCKGNQINGT